MSNEITMPKLSDTMEEGKILRWLKHPGDKVSRGDALAEVETDKADMVLEAFENGVLEEIILPEGESAKVGEIIARITAPGERPAAPAQAAPVQAARQEEARAQPKAKVAEGKQPLRAVETPRGSTASAPSPEGEPAQTRRPQSAETSRAQIAPMERRVRNGAAPARPEREVELSHPQMSIHPSAAPTAIPKPPPSAPEESEPPIAEGRKFKVSPLARRAAEEAGIDLAHVRGTGPEGRITKRDVDNSLREQQLFRQRRLVTPAEGLPGSHEELSRMRRTIAQRMAASKREIPHFYVTVEVDMAEAVRFKKSLEATELFEEDISFNDIIIKATTLALGRYPRINASFENDGITIHPSVNIGMAVAVEDGLILPVIKGCERMSLPEIARAAHKLVSKAGTQSGFTSDELSGATFSISNMGMLGVEHFSAVIVPPQAAILAVSAIKARPVVRDGKLDIGTTMMLTVSCDHRIIDGVVAGRFLQEIKRFLENPASLLV